MLFQSYFLQNIVMKYLFYNFLDAVPDSWNILRVEQIKKTSERFRYNVFRKGTFRNLDIVYKFTPPRK